MSVLSKNIIDAFQLFYSHQGGNTALHAAAGKGCVEAVKLLLDRQAKMNAKNNVSVWSYLLKLEFNMKS